MSRTTDLHRLNLIAPTHEGQQRVVQINTTIPILIELKAVTRDGTLRWQTVSIISDASFA